MHAAHASPRPIRRIHVRKRADFPLLQGVDSRRGTKSFRRSRAALVARSHHPFSRRPVTDSTALTADYPLPHPSPAAIFKELDEGGVLLSTADEVYFGVNPVGAKIWSLLPPVSRTFGEMCTELERQYPDAGAQRIRADAQHFIEALIANGLVVTATA